MPHLFHLSQCLIKPIGKECQKEVAYSFPAVVQELYKHTLTVITVKMIIVIIIIKNNNTSSLSPHRLHADERPPSPSVSHSTTAPSSVYNTPSLSPEDNCGSILGAAGGASVGAVVGAAAADPSSLAPPAIQIMDEETELLNFNQPGEEKSASALKSLQVLLHETLSYVSAP